MDRLAFERDTCGRRDAREPGPAAPPRSGALFLAGALMALVVAALVAAEHAAVTSGVAPARAAFDEPPLGRPGRRF